METIAQYSRLNPFGTGENLFRIEDDSMTFDDSRAFKKGDFLRCFFIDPSKLENRKYYLLEQNIDGEFVHSLRFAKVENGLVEFIYLNPDLKDDKIQMSVKDIPSCFTGIAEVVGHDRG